jgi:hypothetical protein
MSVVEPQQPDYLPHSDAAAAPAGGLASRRTLILGHRPHQSAISSSGPFAAATAGVAACAASAVFVALASNLSFGSGVVEL